VRRSCPLSTNLGLRLPSKSCPTSARTNPVTAHIQRQLTATISLAHLTAPPLGQRRYPTVHRSSRSFPWVPGRIQEQLGVSRHSSAGGVRRACSTCSKTFLATGVCSQGESLPQTCTSSGGRLDRLDRVCFRCPLTVALCPEKPPLLPITRNQHLESHSQEIPLAASVLCGRHPCPLSGAIPEKNYHTAC